MIKKKWDTPKLIILERGNPEESCLLACKISGYGPPWGVPLAPGPGWSSICCAIVLYSCTGTCNAYGSS